MPTGPRRGRARDPRWQEQLRIRFQAEIVDLLVIEKSPLHADEEITRTSPRAVAVVMHDRDGDLQLELHIWQSVIEIEQRRIHLRFTWSPVKDERNIDFPSAGRRRLRIVRDKGRPGFN